MQRLDCCSARLHSPRIRKPRARVPTLRLLRPPPQQLLPQQPLPQQPLPQQRLPQQPLSQQPPQSRAGRTRSPQAGSVAGIGPNAAVSVAKAPGDGITGAGPAIITTGSGVGNRLTAEKAAPNRAAFLYSCAGGDQIRTGAQPQDCEGTRPQCSADPARDRRRGDRIGMLFAAVHESAFDAVDGSSTGT